ncbi:RES family NAD+ phosphorylase [Vulgatibacter incomptus]|uniref:RES domain-containing protein n=1 Tax=Vulgatibacter incomptus TaxID=1391653 RepID=A0A0K1PD87_9BACT|nr:RES family NAD+ phosphorylase [Vulgatibacter incomptus]AKU91508.1 hypothetical protein AKJ08_1895 [Vulgatibacter incomptus]
MPWRVVEAQHVVSTRKLVDSDADQQLLEELIERHKPPVPREEGFDGLHFLLFSSFRYPPLRHGSRFGSRFEPSLWYGSEELRTAFAEVAFYRLRFLEGTEAKLDPLMVELSSFQVRVRSRLAADLTAGTFLARAAELCSKVSYAASQALGRELREAGAEMIRYASARDERGAANVALFTPRAFAEKRPRTPQTWLCVATRERIELSRKDYFVREVYAFPRSQFEVDGGLPSPSA